MNRRNGAAALSTIPSPLPQTGAVRDVVSTQVVNGFWQFLPSRSTTFMEKIFFRSVPNPLFVGTVPPFPYQLSVFQLRVPNNQAFILRSFEFNAYQRSPIGNDDTEMIDPGRIVSYLGFEPKVGNRGLFDYTTNVTQRGAIINYNPSNVGGATPPPLPGQGTLFPFTGPVQPLGQNFAAYAIAGELIEMNVWLLRPMPFPLTMVSAQISGYNIPQRALESILTRIST